MQDCNLHTLDCKCLPGVYLVAAADNSPGMDQLARGRRDEPKSDAGRTMWSWCRTPGGTDLVGSHEHDAAVDLIVGAAPRE